MRRASLTIITLAFATAYGFCSPWASTPSILVEEADLAGLSSLTVACDVRGASVWLDSQYRGSAPLDMTGLAPGSHLLIFKASGYYDMAIVISLAGDTKTSVKATLQLRTGFIDIRVSPAQATVTVDGARYAPGIIEVPAGQKDVSVRAFGYEERELSVYVPESLFTSLSVVLEKAPFEAGDFSVSRVRFNPRNAGLKGVARASFRVSAEGGAEVTVRDAEGRTLRSASIGPFDDWSQEYSWDGRDDSGEPVPDGVYSMAVAVVPAPGIETRQESYAFSADIAVDSSMIAVPSGGYGPMYGSVGAPEAFSPSTDGFRVDALCYLGGPVDGSALVGGAAISASLSLALGFDAGIGLELGGGSAEAARVGLRFSAPFTGRFGLSALAEGRVSDAAAGDPAYARLGAALGFGSPFLNVVVMPHVGAYWENGSSARAGIGAAINLSGYTVGAALSATAMTGALANGFSVAWPVETSVELRFAPTGQPLSFRAVAGLGWAPGPSSWKAGIGISSGL